MCVCGGGCVCVCGVVVCVWGGMQGDVSAALVPECTKYTLAKMYTL
jgi:hypothetical protein